LPLQENIVGCLSLYSTFQIKYFFVLPGPTCAEISKQSMGLGTEKVVVPARQATQPGGIGSLKSILGLLRSLKIRDQVFSVASRHKKTQPLSFITGIRLDDTKTFKFFIYKNFYDLET
jgi:hypothetical protein